MGAPVGSGTLDACMTALLSHTNAVPDATLSMFTGSATDLDNLKSLQVPTPFATITGASFEIRSTFTARPVRVAAVIATDLQSAAEISLSLLNGGTTVSDGEPFVVTNGTFITSGGQVYSVRVMQTVDNRSTILLTLPADVTADEIRVTVTGAASTTRIGALWCGPAYEAPVSAGWTMQHEDYSLVSRVGATPWVNRRARVRNFAASFAPLTEAQAIGPDGIQPLLHKLGRSAPVLFVPSDAESRQRLAVYGLLSTPGSVSHIEAGWYRSEIDVFEIGG